MNTKTIKQSVLNIMARVNIDHELDNTDKTYAVRNWLTGEPVVTTALVVRCIEWVYSMTQAMEAGYKPVTISDFDRIRYFILEQDPNAYMTCID